jgi:hypothetical protein
MRPPYNRLTRHSPLVTYLPLTRAISSVVDRARIATRSVAGGALESVELSPPFSLERRGRAIILAIVSRD